MKGFFDALKTFGKSPNIVAWWMILTLVVAVTTIDVLNLPFFLAILTSIVVLGLIIFTTYNLTKFALLKVEADFNEKELTSLVQNLKDGVLIYDPAFKIISLNNAAENIFGLQAKDVLGLTIYPGLLKNPRLKVITQVVFPSLAPAVSSISEGGWPQVVDLNLENPDLRLRTVLNKIENEKKQTVGFLKIIQDRTREEGILESKGEFITTAAHQLRTPLTALHWTLESLAKKEKEPDLKELSTEGLKVAERALKIINDLLDAAKIEEGRFGYRFKETNLNEFLEELIAQAKALTAEYGVKIYFAAAQTYLVQADAEKLGIAVSNLIDNAIKYNVKNGSVTITLDPAPDAVRLEIKDTGVGIPEEETKKMFGKFYRGTNVVQIEPNGSGLGLYIAKNIIENHGGKINLSSVLGRGTTFSIILPLSKGQN
ncbi:MAG: Phosphate regulon sensor protein PhoR (SphS) [Candidatus Jorgensenbacteria bacterium GW2011_GWA1_48_11]|uniref:histidine kinase n=1 Tax=Candidatus Jorgensenbacteria bacterium GW2011_GWA1_48_11 TaxID=1618660 RepID=A0A0G1UBM1_9BACT|nr:MAG: Phosphate regulon sensor protein PhoR (SphS) [Candidatus Jorgensenbacteria bacterium GW2011_GWA1_48_11]KKW12054.1 MAG: Phosphate regulon sensor protein PhoR (SphS) [Candidatus Jorgensenbacteria bacterium GW2011_GWB1_49_9]